MHRTQARRGRRRVRTYALPTPVHIHTRRGAAPYSVERVGGASVWNNLLRTSSSFLLAAAARHTRTSTQGRTRISRRWAARARARGHEALRTTTTTPPKSSTQCTHTHARCKLADSKLEPESNQIAKTTTMETTTTKTITGKKKMKRRGRGKTKSRTGDKMSKDKDKDQGTKSTKEHKDKKGPRRAWMRVHVLRMGA